VIRPFPVRPVIGVPRRWAWRALLASCLSATVAHADGPVPGKASPRLSYDAERGCALVDGAPFFAIGCYDIVPESMPACAAAGFNLAVHANGGAEPSRRLGEAVAAGPDRARALVTAYADAAERAGLWTIENPLGWSEFSTGAWSAHGSPEFAAHFADFLRDPFPLVVGTLRDHPAVVALLGFDEPGPDWADMVGAYYQAVRQRDPARSVVVNFSLNVQDWPGSMDLATADRYPVRQQTPLVQVCEMTRANAEAARRMGRPYWAVPLLEDCGLGPPFRPEDQVAQTYLAVVGGATGIVWWIWPPRHVRSWPTLQRLAGELRSLAPVLTESRSQPEVVVTTPHLRRTVQVRAIRRGTVTFVLAVNATPSPIEAEFRLPQDVSGKANVWFEDRAVQLDQGRWHDRFAGLERHVYALQTTWPTEDPLQVAFTLAIPSAAEPVGPPVAVPGNLISDPGVETDGHWLMRVFPTDEPGNADRRCLPDPEIRHWGNRSAAIVFTDAGKAAAWDTPTVRLEPNTLYRYGAWARMESAGTHHTAAIVPMGVAGRSGGHVQVQDHGGWEEYSGLIWSGPRGDDMWLRCTYGGEHAWGPETSKGSGRVWFDDAYIAPAPAGIRNMVTNGGFEGAESLPGWPAGWFPMWSLLGRTGSIGGPQAPWGPDRAVAWEGQASLRLANADPTTTAPLGWMAHTADAFQFLRGIVLDAGETYTLSAYMRSDRPHLDVIATAGGWASTQVMAVSDAWERYTLSSTPTGTVNGDGFIAFQIRSPGTLWVDGVQFEEGATPTPFRTWQ